jgi:hypothetical protein
MSKRKITIAAVTIVVLVAGSVWAFRSRTDPQVEKVKQVAAEAMKANPGQPWKAFELVRPEMDKLSESQRHQVGHEMHQEFQRQMDKQIDTYFALPPPQRVAYLDKQINEMEKQRKEREARRAQSAQRGGGGGGGPQMGGGGGGGGGGPPRNNNPDARAQRRDRWVDSSTAEQRAKRSAYFSDMRARRIQLGLPPMGGRGPR